MDPDDFIGSWERRELPKRRATSHTPRTETERPFPTRMAYALTAAASAVSIITSLAIYTMAGGNRSFVAILGMMALIPHVFHEVVAITNRTPRSWDERKILLTPSSLAMIPYAGMLSLCSHGDQFSNLLLLGTGIGLSCWANRANERYACSTVFPRRRDGTRFITAVHLATGSLLGTFMAVIMSIWSAQ